MKKHYFIICFLYLFILILYNFSHSPITKLIDIIEQNYPGTNYNKNDLIKTAIKSIINNIDPESKYLDQSEYAHSLEIASGEYGGIGIIISSDKIITKIIPNSPAACAKLKINDIIIGINNINVKDKPIALVSKLLLGEPDSKISIKIMRHNEIIDFSLKRQKITLDNIQYQLFDNFGYLKISVFNESTSKQFKQALTIFAKELHELDFILDLRDNSGGFFEQAIEIADMLIKENIIITKLISKTNIKTILATNHHDKFFPRNIIILTNNYTASAAEVLLLSLKDNNLATVIGDKTYGKKTIQSFFSLGDFGAIALTTHYYASPIEDHYNKEGVLPHIYLTKSSPYHNLQNMWKNNVLNDKMLKKAIELILDENKQ